MADIPVLYCHHNDTTLYRINDKDAKLKFKGNISFRRNLQFRPEFTMLSPPRFPPSHHSAEVA